MKARQPRPPWQGMTVLRGVGPSLANDLWDLGIRTPRGLKGRDAEALYRRLCDLRGERQDPCVLYAFRCAIYQASAPSPRPELCDWWAWKERSSLEARGGR